jgi:O-antigen/teichoic acid export membrane protein
VLSPPALNDAGAIEPLWSWLVLAVALAALLPALQPERLRPYWRWYFRLRRRLRPNETAVRLARTAITTQLMVPWILALMLSVFVINDPSRLSAVVSIAFALAVGLATLAVVVSVLGRPRLLVLSPLRDANEHQALAWFGAEA